MDQLIWFCLISRANTEGNFFARKPGKISKTYFLSKTRLVYENFVLSQILCTCSLFEVLGLISNISLVLNSQKWFYSIYLTNSKGSPQCHIHAHILSLYPGITLKSLNLKTKSYKVMTYISGSLALTVMFSIWKGEKTRV